MLLYVTEVTPRLLYMADFIGNELFGIPIRVCSDIEQFHAYEGPKINYSNSSTEAAYFHLVPHQLLFEHDIRAQQIGVFEFKQLKAFFRTTGDFGFDIFAASFYLISRYEEYLVQAKDFYGRFPHEESLAFREGFLNIPLVNLWLEQFKQSLKEKFVSLVFRHRPFKFLPTYDIDIAWSYRYKGWLRTSVALARDLANGNWKQINMRVKVLRNRSKDPFDCYEWLDALHLYCRLRPYYFFLVAEKQVGYDRNISPGKKPLQDLITYQSQKGTVGIHPSWQSGDQVKLLKEEIGWLEFIIDQPVAHSRQHYIRMQLPKTYRELLQEGITQDFSMGYGSINGFRASIASSFTWFDLEANSTTNLVIKPFCFMDANSFFELKQNPQQAFSELMHYYRAVKKVNGLLVTIWHNNFLGTDPHFKGWREVYEIFLKEEVYWDR